jgi:transcriptional regulator with XRE-family HTH domain
LPHHEQLAVQIQVAFTSFIRQGFYNLRMDNSNKQKMVSQPVISCGKNLARLRKAAGLTQRELARLIGLPQSNIAFWEHADKPPRADILPALAQILGVAIEQIINPNSAAIAATSMPVKSPRGPVGKLRKTFDLVATLPRHQQEKILEVVSLYLDKFLYDKQAP